MADEQLTRRRALGLAAGVAGVGAASLLAPGIGRRADAAGAGVAPELTGTWRSTVTAVNPPIGTLSSLITFASGGGVLESRRPYVAATPFGPILETAGHGRWERGGDHAYVVDFAFLIQGAPDNPLHAGEPLGTDNVHWDAVLDGASGVLSGPFRSEVRDEAGNAVFAVEGVIEATRFSP